ncbi:hypothetical protein [Pseudoalteromonas luteoviolacea]|uniref:hypothetical protein n=1 Tax=Pseudoalteromonas luteoviolacea TaxID=43657 RepID=UPI001B361EA2|nr:hypothetical protein [Pseudoalteromonas luteoviolacea]MBQ4839830.1 hypothetical protein [Pseudoalteromonas luteoviolacea]
MGHLNFYENGLIIKPSGLLIETNLPGLHSVKLDDEAAHSISTLVLSIFHADISCEDSVVEEFKSELVMPLIDEGGQIPVQTIQDFLHFRGFRSDTTAYLPKVNFK